MNSGPIVAMVWEGLDAVKTGRGKLRVPAPLSQPHSPNIAPLLLGCPTFPLPSVYCAPEHQKLTSQTLSAMLGATNPLASAPGTIRGDYALQTGRNVAHGSDSVENAEKEIALWFKPEELQSWELAQKAWIYE